MLDRESTTVSDNIKSEQQFVNPRSIDEVMI